MVIPESNIRFDLPQKEFTELGISSVRLETASGNQDLSVDDFCGQLPTAAAFVREYGFWRTAPLISKQFEHRRPELQTYNLPSPLRRLIQLNCFLAAANYCLGNEGYYSEPLPYSVGLTLEAQLAWGVSSKFKLPSFISDIAKNAPPNVTVHIPSNNIPVDSEHFTWSEKRTTYRDPNLGEAQLQKLKKDGLATLVGACLLYYPFTPYETAYIMRKKPVWINANTSRDQLTIPGGHTMTATLLPQTLKPLQDQLHRGKRGRGHTLLDASGLRETVEETGLPVVALQTARPLARGDQMMLDNDANPVWYLSHLWKAIIWANRVKELRDGDGNGYWRIFEPDMPDYESKQGLLRRDLTPIARIALRAFQE